MLWVGVVYSCCCYFAVLMWVWLINISFFLIKEQSLYNRKPYDSKIIMMLVHLVKLLIGDPPNLDNLKYVWDHLLLPDLNTVNVIRGTNGDLEATVSLIESKCYSAHLTPIVTTPPCILLPLASHLTNVDTRLTSVSTDSLTLARTDNNFIDGLSESSDTDSDLEVLDLEFDVKSIEGRLPGSSYAEEETWLTWTDITGTNSGFANSGL